MPLYCRIDKKHNKLSNILEPPIKTNSILKENSLKIVYLLLFQLSSLKTLVSSKNYVIIFQIFISGLSEIRFLKLVDQIVGKTRTSLFLRITIEVLVERKWVQLPLSCQIDKKHHKVSNIIEPQIKTFSILKDNSMKIIYLLLFQLSFLQTLASTKNYVSIFPSSIKGLLEEGFLK